MSEIGDNSVSADELRAFIERIERLEEVKAGIASDVKDVYAEAKGRGYDAPAIRAIVKRRKEDADKRREREAVLELYLMRLGMLD